MKTNNILKLFILGFVTLWYHNMGVGQVHDSLLYYMQIAARNNPTVMQKYYAYRATLEKIPQVGSLPDPEVSMGVFLSPMELVAGKQVADIRIMQMFPWFGVLKSARDEMDFMSKAQYESFVQAKLEVMYEVQRLWYELFKIQAALRITEKNIQLLQSLERIALVKFRSAATTSSATTGRLVSSLSGQNDANIAPTSGMNTMANATMTPSTGSSSMPMGKNMGDGATGSQLAELYRIKIEIMTLEDEREAYKNKLITLTAAFNAVLNRQPQMPVAIPDTLTNDTLNLDITVVADSMVKNNPMLKMQEYEQQAYDARKRMTRRMGYPMVGIGLSYAIINKSEMSASAMNGKDMLMPMVTLTLPIYRNKYRAIQSESEFLRQSAEQNYRATYNELQTSYTQAIQLFNDAARRLNTYTNQYLLSQKTLDITLQNFASSASGLTDVLLIRRQTLDYELKKMEAAADFNTAIALIKKLLVIYDME